MKRHVGLILLLAGGCGSLLYGLCFHKATITQEGKREVSIAVPILSGFGDAPVERRENVGAKLPERSPGTGDNATADDRNPFQPLSADATGAQGSENPFEGPAASPAPPDVRFQKVTQTFVVAREEPEWAIVRDVTVGGIARLPDGQLKRTYSGKPPSLCPS
jgi:hypothetical protein